GNSVRLPEARVPVGHLVMDCTRQVGRPSRRGSPAKLTAGTDIDQVGDRRANDCSAHGERLPCSDWSTFPPRGEENGTTLCQDPCHFCWRPDTDVADLRETALQSLEPRLSTTAD